MAFVLDPNDPTNLGMFSKAGRFTSEKYIIFQKKDEIINNQRKFLKVTSLPHLKMDFEGKDHLKALHEEDEEKARIQPNSKGKPKFEPFSQQLSREEFYQTKKVKHPAPPCGFYNPKFNRVEKPVVTLFNYKQEKTKDQFRSTMTDFDVEEASRPLPKKTPKKVVGPTAFGVQTNRRSALNSAGNPHESRFNFFEVPTNLGKNKRPQTVQMNKTLGRDLKFLFKSMEYSPDYEPNFEFGRKGLGSPGPRFEKVTARKSMGFKSPSINQNFFDPKTNEELKFSRTTVTLFDKTAPRDSNPGSPLPCFMQKSMNTRFAVGTVREKALEINNFGDGKFQTVYSSFSPTIFRSTL